MVLKSDLPQPKLDSKLICSLIDSCIQILNENLNKEVFSAQAIGNGIHARIDRHDESIRIFLSKARFDVEGKPLAIVWE